MIIMNFKSKNGIIRIIPNMKIERMPNYYKNIRLFSTLPHTYSAYQTSLYYPKETRSLSIIFIQESRDSKDNDEKNKIKPEDQSKKQESLSNKKDQKEDKSDDEDDSDSDDEQRGSVFIPLFDILKKI